MSEENYKVEYWHKRILCSPLLLIFATIYAVYYIDLLLAFSLFLILLGHLSMGYVTNKCSGNESSFSIFAFRLYERVSYILILFGLLFGVLYFIIRIGLIGIGN